jgi:uncharacterized Zn finger protein
MEKMYEELCKVFGSTPSIDEERMLEIIKQKVQDDTIVDEVKYCLRTEMIMCPKCGYPHMMMLVFSRGDHCPDCGWVDRDAEEMRNRYVSVRKSLDSAIASGLSITSTELNPKDLKVLLAYMNGEKL